MPASQLTVKELIEEVRGLRVDLGEATDRQDTADDLMIQRGKTQRILKWVVGLDLLITVAFGFNLFRTSDAATKAKRAVKQTCVQSNQVRQANHDLWTYVLTLPPQPGSTPPSPAVIEGFKKELNEKFALVDCKTFK